MSDFKSVDSRLNRVYQHSGDKRGLYDDWASSYDSDLLNDMGYVAHIETCRELISQVTDREARILDAGCGTGLAGTELKQVGYRNLHGFDYSSEMLARATATDAYQTLVQHDLNQPFESDINFDAAISVGVFSFSHLSAERLPNITSSLKLGAIALVTINGKAWREVDWESKLRNFNQVQQHARLIDVKTIDYLKTEGIDGRLLTLKRAY